MSETEPQSPRPPQDGRRPDPQQRIAALRAGLLGGRGPGASKTELEAHQRERVAFGGVPVTVARGRESLIAAQARGDSLDEAQAHAARRLDRLATTPPPRRHSHRLSEAPLALALGLLLGFTAARLPRRGQRRGE